MSEDRSQSENEKSEKKPGKGPGFLKVLQSVLAGALGVQSSKRREEDFESGNPLPYIIAGIIFLVIFLVTIALIVQWVISAHGS